ncbi:folic acid synthesis protein-like protein [Ophiobolus disseminans]|uniref:Folic acid synthesis protein FOL1 n=1 Tax=Ophiobolus disseminans TaxID=1469910 RepID=A0A6A6ZT47_9PLEO|nr:folic acid synthesis protein-like protein [Ophiobolus disseminans]
MRQLHKSGIRFTHSHNGLPHRAFIALGSNMGDRVAMIEQACKEMDASRHVKILQTSSLYETKAMYVLDQDNFVNGACEVATSLRPLELLEFLQSIENNMGRVKVIDKGPRNIDLDILVYTDGSDGDYQLVDWNDERLKLPHKLMFEREFVLRPLSEYVRLLSNEDHPSLGYSHHGDLSTPLIRRKLAELRSEQPLSPLTCMGRELQNLTPHQRKRPTQIMSILNVTPDSFSDGGKSYDVDENAFRQTVTDHIANGATIIDVGGQSTRPGAVQVDSAQELARVLPAIKTIRSLNLSNIAISVDTYQADVAQASITAGAHIINDVSAGLMDPDMLPTAARLGCTICLMHMRGTPKTMTSLTNYPDGLIETVGRELLERVHAAERAGIRRWRIILDPGIGFAKTQAQNLELLRRFDELRRYPGLDTYPWLVGTSRKAFIGRITGVKDAKDRVWGTAASVAAAVQGGADVVRVHDVKEMAQVAGMADAIWRV